MKKKGIAFLGGMILVGISAIILLFMFKALWPILTGTAQASACNVNMIASAFYEKLGMLAPGHIELSACEAEVVTIDRDIIERFHVGAKKRIEKYYDPKNAAYYAEAREKFKIDQNNRPTRDSMNEWALDFIMAKKMELCWNEVGKGALDVFSTGVEGYFYDKTFCVVCSVVNFADDMPDNIRNKNIYSLYGWTKAEPFYKTTYYSFLAEGQTYPPDENSMSYTTKVPVAVVYTEVKEAWIAHHWQDLVGFAAGAVTIGIPGVGWVAGGAIHIFLRIASPVATRAAAGIIAAGITEAQIKASDTTKFLAIHPFSLIRKPRKDGGLGCTDVIG